MRLLPCDVVARVAPIAHQVARFEIGLAQRLAESESPVAVPDPRAEPRVYESEGFVVTLWTYYEPAMSGEVSQHLVETTHLTPDLAAADRKLLVTTLRSQRQAIVDRGAAEQMLHGEPHLGNVLSTKSGLLFIDFETCCRGPVEFDLAHVPEDVSERYADVDQDLLSQCRALVLAVRRTALRKARPAARYGLQGPRWPWRTAAYTHAPK